MKHYFFVNAANELRPSQTTTLLIAASVRLRPTFVFDVPSLVFADSRQLRVRCRQVLSDSAEHICQELRELTPNAQDITTADTIIVRSSPGRDAARLPLHLTWLDIFCALQHQGFHVHNNPETLRRMFSKSYMLSDLARFMPRGFLCSGDQQRIRTPYVTKPLFGSRGEGVKLITDVNESNTEPDIYCVQEFVNDPSGEEHRVLVLNGALLYEGSKLAAYRKLAPSGEFRHNLAQGAKVHVQSLSASQLAVLKQIAEWCKGQKIALAGVDLKDEKLIELNVFSPGGVDAIAQTSGVDFSAAILCALTRSKN